MTDLTDADETDAFPPESDRTEREDRDEAHRSQVEYWDNNPDAR